MRRSERVLVFLVLFSLLPALWVLGGRWRTEARNRTVAVVLEGRELEQLSTMTDLPLPELLSHFRRAGATGVAVAEETLETLLERGRVQVWPGEGEHLTLLAQGVPDEAWEILARKVPGAKPGVKYLGFEEEPSELARVSLRGSLVELGKVGLGFPEKQVAEVKEAGLEVVARIANFPSASPAAIADAFARTRETGARLVIFDEEEVLGYGGLLGETAKEMRRQGLVYGSVEFAGQMGDGELSARLADRLARVHSIAPGELATMSPATAARRYARAARERNVRVCYVHLRLSSQPDLAKACLEHAADIASRLRRDGFVPGRLRQPAGRRQGPGPRALILLGAAAGGALLLRRLGPLGERAQVVAFVVLLIGLGAPALRGGGGDWRLAALGSACFFPALGIIAWQERLKRAIGGEGSFAGGVGQATKGFLACTAISVVGGVYVAGLLSDPAYLVGVGQFAGVKLAYLFPAAVVGLALLAGAGEESARETWRAHGRRLESQARAVLARPVLVIEVLVGLALLAGAAIFLVRTGNQPQVPVSGLEMRLRELLEDLLYARPRTKEFLLGHPALILSFLLLVRWRPARGEVASFLLLVGAIGQASVVNTFCHLPSPLVVTAARVGNGVWLGLAFGLLGAAIWEWGWRLGRRKAAL